MWEVFVRMEVETSSETTKKTISTGRSKDTHREEQILLVCAVAAPKRVVGNAEKAE